MVMDASRVCLFMVRCVIRAVSRVGSGDQWEID